MILSDGPDCKGVPRSIVGQSSNSAVRFFDPLWHTTCVCFCQYQYHLSPPAAAGAADDGRSVCGVHWADVAATERQFEGAGCQRRRFRTLLGFCCGAVFALATYWIDLGDI